MSVHMNDIVPTLLLDILTTRELENRGLSTLKTTLLDSALIAVFIFVG